MRVEIGQAVLPPEHLLADDVEGRAEDPALDRLGRVPVELRLRLGQWAGCRFRGSPFTRAIRFNSWIR